MERCPTTASGPPPHCGGEALRAAQRFPYTIETRPTPYASPSQWGGGAKRRWGTSYDEPNRSHTSIAVPHRTGGMVLMNPLNEPGGARGARRRNSGSETMPPKKLRSPVSFGIFSKRNRGTFFFAACLANPELRLKHLRAPRDRPRHARHATEVLFLLRYSSVPAAGAGPPWLLRLLRARSKGSRRHAAPRVGISDCDIVSV